MNNETMASASLVSLDLGLNSGSMCFLAQFSLSSNRIPRCTPTRPPSPSRLQANSGFHFTTLQLAEAVMKDYSRDSNDTRYGIAMNRDTPGIPDQVGFNNNGLFNPRPDYLQGLYVDTLPSHMHSQALHGSAQDSLALCHFAAELKRTDDDFRLETIQAAYDGAAMVYARNQALGQARAGAANRQGLGGSG